jgi:hypothetical protein
MEPGEFAAVRLTLTSQGCAREQQRQHGGDQNLSGAF